MSSTKLNNAQVAAVTDQHQMVQKKQQKGKGLYYLFSRRKTKTSTTGNVPITHSTTTSPFSPNDDNLRKDMTLVSLENKLEQTGKAFAHYEAVHDIMTDIMAKNREICALESQLSQIMLLYMNSLSVIDQRSNSLRRCLLHLGDTMRMLGVTRKNMTDKVTNDFLNQLKLLEDDNQITEAKMEQRLNSEIDYQLAKRNIVYHQLVNSFIQNYTSYFETASTTMKNTQNKLLEQQQKVEDVPAPKREDFNYGNEKKIFGINVNVILQRWDEPGPVPVAIEEMISYLEKNCLGVEGLLRITGDAQEMEKLKHMIDEGKAIDYSTAQISNKPHTICSLIKLFTRELPEPLLSFELFDSWIAAVTLPNKQDQINEMKRLLELLPKDYKNCLGRLMQFFARVAESEATKMPAVNIAPCFGMNLLRMKPGSEDHIKLAQNTKNINKVCELLITHCREFFQQDIKLNQYRGTIYLKELGLTKVLHRLNGVQAVPPDEGSEEDGELDDTCEEEAATKNDTAVIPLVKNEHLEQTEPSIRAEAQSANAQPAEQ